MEEINYLPVEFIELDKLGFEAKAKEIATFINSFPSHLPYSIGIRGPWGSGKSTMLNFIEQSLSKENCSVIRFNPWMVTDRDSLINNLFEEIYYEIDGGYTNTKQKFAEYAQKIIPSATKIATYFGAISNGLDSRSARELSSGTGEAIKGVGELLFDKPLSRRKKELYDEMQRTYSYTEKKIVVMIDELDRLFPNEIITVFQMMKSALDFPGIIFIVAMDEMMVYEALEKKGINRPFYYLEKIFQRNYYINTKYQIRTLTDHFLIPYLNTSLKAEKQLVECLDAFIFLDENKFPLDFPLKTIQELEEEWELIPLDVDKIKSSYSKIFRSFNEDLNLANPRTFLKFSMILREIWPKYYENIMSGDANEIYRLHAAFLIIMSYIWYPTECEEYTFNRNSAKEISEPFIKALRGHLSLIIPRYKITTSKNSYSTKDLSDVIKDATRYLNQYPDYIRHIRIQNKTEDGI
ncbi:KAP family P-loop NTPase fold protein [Sporosarcina limicola]|uniref:Cdc6-like AAA superfamily ATPase n=1 Tax=Sporosarcina limicola TaxID=34101 RepID=A0A927MLD9_9BACL|nr:P-loop NTPase fold protein [Sporosarcina limicola]MBE1556865.1 Cdc6-like AAA superfamily ATPase [Sporosarcina limicola]